MSAFLIWIALGQAPGPSAASFDTAAAHELSRTETESRARGDLSARRGVVVSDVKVVASDARTWPDRRLGCVTRRGIEEPVPVPGYRIVLEADGVRETYHTDRWGRIVRCEQTFKRLLPMLR
jgi:hypothetical protein